ncbi:MAG: NAD(P)H-hydrate epimerase [Tabrizicola sp.]
MTELLTAAQMRAIEQAAIASGKVTGLELMERAGRGVVAAIFEEWPDLRATAHRAVVLCGPGNNGGDGFVVARLLKAWGWEVAVFALAPPATEAARTMADRWAGQVRTLADLDWPDLAGRPLVVDAMFGGGLARAVAPGVWGALQMALERGCRVVAVDIPSGLCADSGRVRAAPGYITVPVGLTVTFQAPRRGHHLQPAADLCGRLRVADIGLAAELDALLRADDGAVVELARPRGGLGKAGGHKFSHGHALVLSGPAGRGGAARLAARGALRVGAGLVTLGCPLDAIPEHAARLDAVMLRPVADADALAAILEDARINALCLGPGMGTGAREEGVLAVALGLPAGSPPPPSPPHEGEGRRGTSTSPAGGEGGALPLPLVGRGEGRGALSRDRRNLVLDADALTILSQHPDLFAALHGACVLTPHAGEFARLFPDIAEKLAAPATKGPAYSKVDATREAAKRAGCVVLFKGPDTVIADPSGHCAVNSAHYDRAAPWLATAGSGDVLAGFITGLLARGVSPFDAACTGAWLHVACALSFGPGLIAEDLPEELPKVFRALGL